MALRLANKFPSLVNNVVLRQSSSTPRQIQPILPAAKTRYPLNQLDANSYIEGLKAKASCLDVVRTFDVLVSAKPDAHPKTSTELNINALNLTLINGQRNLASKAGDKKKTCKKPCKKEKKKCPKMSDGEKCLKFKIENCKKAKNFICTRRPFIFKECKKKLAPYPSFSEACHEVPYLSVNECRDCPWVEQKHPTFKRPKDKYGPPGRKFFHTNARSFVVQRSEMTEEAAKKLQEQEQSRAYESLNQALFDRKSALRKMNSPKPSVQIPSRLPRSQRNDLFQEFYNLKQAAQRIAPVKKAKMGDCMEKPAMKLDEAQQATGGMLCKMVPKKPTSATDMTCEKLGPSPTCPEDLLDRKPYPKYRKEMKKRIAKEKVRKKRLQAIRDRKETEKLKPKKKCGVVEAVSLWCHGGAGVALETRTIENMNVILAKDRVKLQGVPKCPKNSCDQGAFHKKKCPKKIKSRICPKDLLDRKPYKKFRESKTKCKKNKGKKGKRAAGVNQEQMSAMMMEAFSGPSATSRPDVQ